MSNNENEDPNVRRSTRARTQRDANPCDFLDDEINEEKKGTEKAAESNGPSNKQIEKPSAHRSRYWMWDADINGFQTIDSKLKLFRNSWWNGGRRSLHYDVACALSKAEKALVADQEDQEHVILERTRFPSSLTQMPYHAEMLQAFKYFAQGLQQHSDLKMLTIVNHNLPPSPWLADSILPVLERNSNRYAFDGNMTSLELSNCSLSGDDLAALATYLLGNTTLCNLDISRNNIDSVDTCKTLAKAIKKNPALIHVNLAHCSLGGGCHDVLNKILVACKDIDSLEIGHSDFDSKGVAMIANKFLRKKIALTSFSLMGAPVDKENKKLLEEAITKNETLEKLCFRSNGLKLPGILRATNEVAESLSRLTHLDLSFNSLPVQGAKAMAKFLERADSSLVTLIMTNNHLTTKGAQILLPALKENTTLENFDLSKNWLNDEVAPAVIDLLQNNSTLRNLDLSDNKQLKAPFAGRRRWIYEEGRVVRWEELEPARDRGRAEIVKGALFDTESLSSLANSNHTCGEFVCVIMLQLFARHDSCLTLHILAFFTITAVFMTRSNGGNTYEEMIRKINSLDVCEGKKIRYKVVLALSKAKKDLYDPRSFNDVSLELMPYLLEMIQQEIGAAGFGEELVAKSEMKETPGRWRWNNEARRSYIDDPRLNKILEIITNSQDLALFFNRGAGEFEFETMKKTAQTKKKSKSKSRKRRRFGDEDDDDDEAYVPRGARTRGRWEYNRETRNYDRIPPPAEFR